MGKPPRRREAGAKAVARATGLVAALTGLRDDLPDMARSHAEDRLAECVDGARALTGELARVRAAVELHRPVLLDKYGNHLGVEGDTLDDPAKCVRQRCDECDHWTLPGLGCQTWQLYTGRSE